MAQFLYPIEYVTAKILFLLITENLRYTELNLDFVAINLFIFLHINVIVLLRCKRNFYVSTTINDSKSEILCSFFFFL